MIDESPKRMDADDLYREVVLGARTEGFESKLLAGPRLFDLACQFARAGIRMQHPDFDDAAVENELRRRLCISRRLEDLP